jgi:alpha-ketoglutaric semialdehyde dehydrogenase
VAACAYELVDILLRAGVPDGVLNLVLGAPAVTGPILSGHPDVDAVSFTGSVPTGQAVRMSAVAHGARVQLELGGKNPLVVLADADLDLAVELAVQGAWGSTGQRCTSSSFLVVEAPVHDEFVARLSQRRAELQVGHALGEGTQMGPLVDERQMLRSRSYVEDAASGGAEVIGGELLELEARGCYQAPALVLGTSPSDRINREEVFGPVASVIRVFSYDEALAVANATPYPLSAAVVTRDLASAQHFRENSVAGMVMVNLATAGVDHNMPFGGAGASSYGPREQGTGAIEFFTETRTHYVTTGRCARRAVEDGE